MSDPSTEQDVDIATWFADHGFGLVEVEGDPATRRTRVLGRNATWDLFVSAPDDRVVRVFSLWEKPVPAERLTEMMWLAGRVNGMLPVGAVVVDEVRGTVGVHTSVDVSEDRLSAGLLARLVGHNVDTFDQLVDPLEAVLAGADGRTVDVVLRTA